ncbi:reverse transcriptase [Cucumis melo var. makuwa]|uniref:Reverse transcriptase n=1 Tax=Cucumis melo var. makuwa TaxID=1194695 RepID=A0A5D3BZ42_CUCMM|nr:reverse transcriptase [Cucumis melo var. makuwa]
MQYMKTCFICQQDKVEKAKVAWLLEPLPVPTRLWDSVSMDFITHLSKVGDLEAILVIIDQFLNSSTGKSPFQIVSGRQPLLPHIVDHPYVGNKGHRLVRKYEGPVEVLKKIGNTSYRVSLPAWMKIHSLVHVSNLKPYHQDLDDKHHNNCVQPSVDLKQKEKKEVEEILAGKVRKGRRPTRGIHEFLVKWKNLLVKETSWEHVEKLKAWN